MTNLKMFYLIYIYTLYYQSVCDFTASNNKKYCFIGQTYVFSCAQTASACMTLVSIGNSKLFRHEYFMIFSTTSGQKHHNEYVMDKDGCTSSHFTTFYRSENLLYHTLYTNAE